MRRDLRFILLGISLEIAWSPVQSARAQSLSTAALIGNVTELSCGTAAEAVVSLTSFATQVAVTKLTTADGLYKFVLLASGKFS